MKGDRPQWVFDTTVEHRDEGEDVLEEEKEEEIEERRRTGAGQERSRLPKEKKRTTLREEKVDEVIRERDQLRAELEALKGIYSSGPSRHLNSHSSARESLPQDPSSTSSEHLTRWLLAQNFMLSKQVEDFTAQGRGRE
uniref:Uncharacterized protein n=2 Tax=Guillardia theta TaxID=55529 RepID=A0A7S4PQD4_GUITH|mmetsp:Transcript_9194/g.30654  ORF Transcript_9194/g.30654 Transcript_9194/m.30654 type:complete len:139 (+) Transcript_9194:207-623(+)